MRYSFNIPTKISILTFEELNKELICLKGRSILLFITARMTERFGLNALFHELSQNNKIIYADCIRPNPSELDIADALSKWEDNIDTVIAFGGGSAIDLAKAAIGLSYLSEEGNVDGDKVLNEIISKNYIKHRKSVDFIAIPTTAGTSSEMTAWATIWRSDKQGKLSVEADWLKPGTAYIIPETTLSLPPRLTLSSGFDALTHAVESYWSKTSNPVTRELSKASISNIVRWLPLVIKNPDSLEYRTKLFSGVILAGMAFGNTKTAACHSISYPLTMLYGIEHGFAVMLTLTEVMKKNKPYIIEFDELLNAFAANSIQDIEECISMTGSEIQGMRLRNFDVDKESIPEIARMSFTVGRMDNNPVLLSVEEVEEILYNIY